MRLDKELIKTYSKKDNIKLGWIAAIGMFITTLVMLFMDYHAYLNGSGEWWQLSILHGVIYLFMFLKWRLLYKYWKLMKELYPKKDDNEIS
ncbi:MAG: hypothetical protein SLAVMIC_00860 [uncultured marine phage]|uniref:Uncharacterized protein n=1 Tax=uncultured marine phage TaxID=707152 RepID=A0A8D9C9M8_9VIRU|nr:MAG: hypothetical protein SLAVMIC_00860 [uncultured marine phage]